MIIFLISFKKQSYPKRLNSSTHLIQHFVTRCMCASLLTSPMFFELAFEVGSAPKKKNQLH